MGAYLSKPETSKHTEEAENAYLKSGVTAMQGWRTEMEDAHTIQLDIDTNTSLFGVFDGHGGKEVAIYASRHLHTQLLKNKHYGGGNFEKCLQETFVQLDANMSTVEGTKALKAILNEDREPPPPPPPPADTSASRRKKGEPQRLPRALSIAPSIEDQLMPHYANDGDSTAGCTAVAALVHGRKIYVANAGDSRCVMCRDGEAHPLSFDHKPTDAKEELRINKAGGSVLEGRVNGTLNLSRALGDMEFKQRSDLRPEEQMITAYPDVVSVEIKPTDEFMVLACDGIWDVMTNEQCVHFVRERLAEGKTPAQITVEMVDACLAPDSNGTGIGCDNMSAMVVVFQKALKDLP
mmetsp:Transcript_7983/g.9257  ORF Transcript_7983/g.9257 Transcript_7983/m.9257 type:complete len:350 (-) Transcript_7983:583-1632(-)